MPILKRDSKCIWPSRSLQGGLFSLSYAKPPQPRSPRRFEHKALAARASLPLFSSISLHFKHDPAVHSLLATITMLSLTTRSQHLAHSCHCSTVSARSLSIDLVLLPNSNRRRCCCPYQRQSLTEWSHCMCRCTFKQHWKVSKPWTSDAGNSVCNEILLHVCKWHQPLPTTNLSSSLIIGWLQSITQSNQSKVAKSEKWRFPMVIIIGRVCRKGKVNICWIFLWFKMIVNST